MFNTFVFLRNSNILKCFQKTQFEAVIQRSASFTARNILQESSQETGTLTTRFAKHIALELQKDGPIVPTSIRYADYFPITDTRYLQKELARIKPDQMPALIIFAFTYRSNADPNIYSTLLNELDATALKLLPNMDLDTILRTLYSFLYLMPNWIMHLDFYNAAMKLIAANGLAEDMPKEKFVQICFYLGLNKSRDSRITKSFTELLNSSIDSYILKLNTMDFVIIASSAFRTSVRIESREYNQRLVEEVEQMSESDVANKDALLITLIKSMRLQRLHSTQMCEQLREYCEHGILDRLQLRGSIHLFAYFADNLWDDNIAVKPLVVHCLGRILSTKKFDTMHNEEVRCKDIANFLWCCAQLNCKISVTDLKRIESIILRKIDENEYRYFVDQLVDSCLSLLILGHKSRELIEATVALKMRALNSNRTDRRDQPKVESRFQVLLAAVAIEEPTWRFKDLQTSSKPNVNTAAPQYLLKNRKDFSEIRNKISKYPNVESATLVCPVSGINIPSILVSFKEPNSEKMILELLSEEQVLQSSKSPMGLIRLKIHLLELMGYKVITLPAVCDEDESTLDDIISNNEGKNSPKTQTLKM